jgi:dTDP-4-dehydrorhamnose reductase
MTWLIIGARGQLGMALSVVLRARGIDFIAWNSEELNICSSKETLQKINWLGPNVIINAAAWTNVDVAEVDPNRAFQVNAHGAYNLAVAAKRINSVFVHISTDYIFSGESNRPWKENDIQEPLSVYGASKAAGERLVVSEYGESSLIFRTAWLYSPWGKNFAKTMTRFALSSNHEVRVVNDQTGQPTSALDLSVRIVDSVLAEIPFGIYHATNGGEATWFDFARKIFTLSGQSESRLIPVTSNDFPVLAKRPTYSVLSHDAWENIGNRKILIPKIRNWTDALIEAMPSIIQEVKFEMSCQK